MNTLSIPTAQIRPDPAQPRKDFPEEELQQLAASIHEHGQLVPVIAVRESDHFLIVDGERRYRACTLAGIPEMSAVVLDRRPEPAELLVIQFTCNAVRSDLKPVEKARAMKRLQELKGWNNAALAEHLHVSAPSVTMYLSLLKLPESIQSKVESGGISISAAYALTRAGDSQEQLADRLEKGALTRDAIAARVRKKPDATEQKKASRAALTLDGTTATVSNKEGMDMDGLCESLEKLWKEAKKARGQGIVDITTFSKMLRDKAKPQADS